MVSKFNVSMNPELYKKLCAACKQMGLTRSAFVSFAVSQLLTSQQIATQLPELLEAVNKLQALAAANQAAADAQSADGEAACPPPSG